MSKKKSGKGTREVNSSSGGRVDFYKRGGKEREDRDGSSHHGILAKKKGRRGGREGGRRKGRPEVTPNQPTDRRKKSTRKNT